MFSPETQVQGIIQVANDDYLPVLVESFLTDRRAGGMAHGTVRFYAKKLRYFSDYCDSQALAHLADLSPDFLRRFILLLSESHNPGGVHAIYRSLRAFLRWVEAEEILPNWKNPIKKVKAPKVAIEPFEPVSLEDVKALLSTCLHGFTGERDRAILLVLLDTGIRASELTSLALNDLDLGTGEMMVERGKGGKPRTVFIGRRTRRAIRAYLRERKDNSPALFVTHTGEKIGYDGLRAILTRRATMAKVQYASPHDFRRAFALNMLRNGVDIYTLAKLMGHSGIQVLQRYLAISESDTRLAHEKGSPVDLL